MTTVPLLPLLRDAIKSASSGMTLGEMRRALLSVGVMVESHELSSAVTRLRKAEQIRRERVARAPAGLGPRRVWRYHWSKT